MGDVKTFSSFIVECLPGIDVRDYNTVVIWCEAFDQIHQCGRVSAPPSQAENEPGDGYHEVGGQARPRSRAGGGAAAERRRSAAGNGLLSTLLIVRADRKGFSTGGRSAR